MSKTCNCIGSDCCPKCECKNPKCTIFNPCQECQSYGSRIFEKGERDREIIWNASVDMIEKDTVEQDVISDTQEDLTRVMGEDIVSVQGLW